MDIKVANVQLLPSDALARGLMFLQVKPVFHPNEGNILRISDAHRSVLMVMSPYAKKNYIGNVHYSFGSIFKTFWKVFGIPFLNQYDVSATDLSTNTPDFSPFNALPADKRIFDPQKALDPFDEKFDWKAFNESEELDRTETMQKRRAEDDKHEKNN